MLGKSVILLVTLLLLAGGILPSAHAQDAVDTSQPLPFYLLTVRGTLAAETLDDAQTMHNETAGAEESIAAARSLGDLSHMIYLPLEPAESGAGEVLFIDQWSSAEGLNQFFANPQVQEQAGQLFTEREATVWTHAEGFYAYHLSTPYGQNDRFVAMLRGTVPSREEAMALHNQIVASNMNAAHLAGDLSHEVFFMLTPPGTPESLEFLAVDVWNNVEGMNAYYQNPAFASGVQQLFTTAPTISVWTQTTGEWVEW
jgi:quinol monooxygenase YgiN